MKQKKNLAILWKKGFAIFLGFLIIFSSLTSFLQTPFSPKSVEAADNSCSAGGLALNLQSRVGGVALDQAATFLASMDDITGAYYDSTLDRIVFVGKKNTTLPEFDKDDLAVAIRAVVFNNTIPAVSMENDPTDPGGPNLKVFYYGGIENTRFGQVLFNADNKMKSYVHGYNEDGSVLNSSVPGYRSFFNLFLDKNPSASTPSSNSRWWITPRLISLKKDDASSSFVFDQAIMQIRTEPIWSTNEPKWNQAAQEFADFQTNNYDAFAQETPSYAQTKQLGKIVSVIKWLKDNNIQTDFDFARDYAPIKIATPVTIPKRYTPWRDIDGGQTQIVGGADFYTNNTYSQDTTGASAGLKASSQAVPTTKEDIHWTFTKDGQQYDSVAVTADAFRTLGSYNTAVTDMAFPTVGDLTLAFQRSYSSYSGGQVGVGRGWNFLPAKLVDNKIGWYVPCSSTGQNHTWKLALQTAGGLYETFTFADCTTGWYGPDQPQYHTRMYHNADGTFTATLKDQTQYIFDSTYKLISYKDSHNNSLSYVYDSSGKLTAVKDPGNHQLTLSYNGQGLISTLTDWAGRVVQYGYDTQSNLVQVTDPNGGITKYAYDANNKLAKVINRLDQTTVENSYNQEAKIASQKDAGGVTTSFNYDELNRTITASDNNGRIGKTVYDEKARVLQATDALGSINKYTYATEFAPITLSDKKGNTTKFTYDNSGNQTAITYPNNKQVRYSYNGKNHLTQISDDRYLNNQTSPKITNFAYTSVGTADNLLSYMDEAGLSTIYSYFPNGELSGFYDPKDNQTVFTKDSFGNILTSKDPAGNITNFEYDSLGRMTKQTDPDGKVTTFSYDANNNIISQTNAAGTTLFNFNKENQLTKTTSPKGTTSNLNYNNSGSLTNVVDAVSSATSYGRDPYQNITSTQDALNKVTNYTYDKLNQQTMQTTPLGRASKFEYDKNGNIIKRTDPLGLITTYNYDNLDRLTKTTYPNGSSINPGYDDRGNLSSVNDSIGNTYYSYDLFDRLTRVTSPYGMAVNYTYDANDNLTKITYPDTWYANYGYDPNDRLTSVTDWSGAQTKYTYNKNGTVATRTVGNGIVTNYGYDGNNRLTSLEHLKSTVSLAKFIYQRDNLGNITQVTESGSFVNPSPSPTPSPTPTPSSTPTPSPTPGSGAEILNTTWTLVGNNGAVEKDKTIPSNTLSGKTSIKVTFNLHGSSFGTGDDQASLIFVQNGDWRAANVMLFGAQNGFNGPQMVTIPISAFHNIGNSSIKLDPNQPVTNLHTRFWNSGAFTVDITSVQVIPAVGVSPLPTSTPNPTPTLTPSPNPNGTELLGTSWTLVGNNGSAEKDKTIASNSLSGKTSIKVTFNLHGTTFGGGEDEASIIFIQNGDWRAANITLFGAQNGLNGPQTVTIPISSFHKIGVPSTKLDPNQPVSNLHARFWKNSAFTVDITSVQAVSSTAFLDSSFRFLVNLVKNVQNWFTVPSAFAQAVPPQFITNFSYDSLGRLTNATYPANTGYSYTYDKVGNRLTQTISGVGTGYTYDGDNQLNKVGSDTYTQNANGNLIAKTSTSGNQTLSYNYENQLLNYSSASVTAAYAYDGLGNRWQKTVGGVQTRYINDLSGSLSRDLAETNSSNVIQNYNLYGLGLISQGSYNYSSRQYLLEDGLGNTRFVTDSAGNLLKSYNYDPFGNVRNTTGAGSSNFKFNQQQNDTESNLYFLRARYYDPTTGRFTSRDPIKGVLTQPQSLNAYQYAYNNPINLSDPSGEQVAEILKFVATKCQPILTKASTIFQRSAPVIQKGEDAVYKSTTEGKPYVGITNNVGVRAGQQMTERGIEIEPVLQNLTRPDARAAEQALIEKYGLKSDGGILINKINSISPNNPTYPDAAEKGKKLIEDLKLY